MKVLSRCAVALSLLLLGSGLVALAADPAIDPSLLELNKVSREAYAKGKATLLSRTSPVIVVEFDELLLLREGKEVRETFTPPIYHTLKALSHLPLGIYGALAPATLGATGDQDWRASLGPLREKADAASARLDRTNLDEAQLRRARTLLGDSIAFIDAALASGAVSEDALRSFARKIAPLTLASAREAARMQIDGLHAAFEKLKGGMSEAELARLYVLVLGAKTPRAGNLQYEYFVNALGRDAADKRVIYMESIFDRQRALDVLGTLVIDRKVGRDFYGDEGRMERDLLSDGATARLLEVFGKVGND
jgi:hypothetical protein